VFFCGDVTICFIRKVIKLKILLKKKKISISKSTTIKKLLFDLENENENLELTVEISTNFIRGELFAILVSFYKSMKYKGLLTKYNFNYENENILDYISRINFFQLIEEDSNEKFRRHDTSSTLIEISEFNSSNLFNITDKVAYLIKHNFGLEESIINCINYCLGEIIANVDVHSGSKINSILYAQYFRNSKTLKLFIIDNGIGIYNSLSSNILYNKLSVNEVLLKSVEEEVTRDKSVGGGYGLFHTAEFIKQNSGKLNIYSFDKVLEVSQRGKFVYNSPIWNGSIIALEINTDIFKDYTKIFTNKGKAYNPTSFNEIIEMKYGNINLDELW
jgi:hypothetical protein